jgi:hypothetical protein
MAIFFHPMFNLKHFIETSRDNTIHLIWRSRDRIGLSRPCLSIGKDADIEPVDGRLNEHLGILEDLLLARVAAKTGIKHVLLLDVLLALLALSLLI